MAAAGAHRGCAHGLADMNLDWLAVQGLAPVADFLTALAIGLLMGLERERNPVAKAGLRTFALVSLAGGVAQFLSQAHGTSAIVAVGLLVVAIAIVAAYYHHHEESHDRDSGTTTIVALVACYLLGALALAGHARIAVILSIVATVLLYFKAELSGAVRGLERRDFVSMLQFAVVTFVVLPLLPDRGFGPYGAFNPRQVWLVVVLITALSFAAYVALRLIGAARGAVIVGVLGGMVSSTATTLSYARIARDSPDAHQLAVTAIIAANLVLPLRLAALAALMAPGALASLAAPLASALAAGAAAAITTARSTARTPPAAVGVANPVELRAALGFAALYSVVLLAVAWLGDIVGTKGVFAAALLSGLTDVDAVTLSGLRMYTLGTLSAAEVATAIVIAMAANAAFKLVIVNQVAGAPLLRRCFVPMAGMVVAAAIAVVAAP